VFGPQAFSGEHQSFSKGQDKPLHSGREVPQAVAIGQGQHSNITVRMEWTYTSSPASIHSCTVLLTTCQGVAGEGDSEELDTRGTENLPRLSPLTTWAGKTQGVAQEAGLQGRSCIC
jgi:hypothetical protein